MEVLEVSLFQSKVFLSEKNSTDWIPLKLISKSFNLEGP
jgi:hypothetical protein